MEKNLVQTVRSNKSSGNFIQSVDRALNILEVFLYKEREMGVTEIANELGLNKATAFGLISTLENRGYLEQNIETSKYRWGLKLMELGFASYAGMDIISISRPYIKEIVNNYGETGKLTVEDEFEAVFVDKVEGSGQGSLNVTAFIGKRNPLYCTAAGKCMLAFMEPDRYAEYAKRVVFHKFTEKTVKNLEELTKKLSEVKKNGYCVDYEETEEGLICVAAPIRNYLGHVIAAMSVSGPKTRMSEDKVKEVLADVKKATDTISMKFGFNPIRFNQY